MAGEILQHVGNQFIGPTPEVQALTQALTAGGTVYMFTTANARLTTNLPVASELGTLTLVSRITGSPTGSLSTDLYKAPSVAGLTSLTLSHNQSNSQCILVEVIGFSDNVVVGQDDQSNAAVTSLAPSATALGAGTALVFCGSDNITYWGGTRDYTNGFSELRQVNGGAANTEAWVGYKTGIVAGSVSTTITVPGGVGSEQAGAILMLLLDSVGGINRGRRRRRRII